jgi:hypothetical protein
VTWSVLNSDAVKCRAKSTCCDAVNALAHEDGAKLRLSPRAVISGVKGRLDGESAVYAVRDQAPETTPWRSFCVSVSDGVADGYCYACAEGGCAC